MRSMNKRDLIIPTALAVLVVILFIKTSSAAENGTTPNPSVIEIKKGFQMDPKDKQHRDLYINAGESSGLRQDVVVEVIRKVTLYDSVHSRSAGEMQIPIAKVKIIFSQPDLSVARFHSWINEATRPSLEYPEVMVGDVLNLASASVEKPSRKQAETEKAETEKETVTETQKETVTETKPETETRTQTLIETGTETGKPHPAPTVQAVEAKPQPVPPTENTKTITAIEQPT